MTIVFKPEIAAKLRTAAASIQRIGEVIGSERATSACQECAAILETCADDYAPKSPAAKYPNHARESAQRLAERMKPSAAAKPTGIASE